MQIKDYITIFFVSILYGIGDETPFLEEQVFKLKSILSDVSKYIICKFKGGKKTCPLADLNVMLILILKQLLKVVCLGCPI